MHAASLRMCRDGTWMNQNAEDDVVYSKRITAVKYFALGLCLVTFVAYGLIVG